MDIYKHLYTYYNSKQNTHNFIELGANRTKDRFLMIDGFYTIIYTVGSHPR